MNLVTLHGFMGSPASWQTALAQPHVAPVLPFHGASPALCTDWEDALTQLAECLPPGPLALLGYSLGARLALGLTRRLGERVRAAVLVSVHAGLAGPERDERARFEAGLAAKLEGGTMAEFVDGWERLPLFATQSAPQRAAQRPARLAHDPRALAGAFRILGTSRMPDYEPTLAGGRTPLLFVAGAEDEKYRALSERYAARGGALALVPGGHNPLVEEPAALGRVALEFLEAA